MALKLNVTGGFQVVVPIRFDRACRGQPQRFIPDIDDRGFAMGTRPATWSTSDARGAMAGITVGDTVKIRVLREDIEDAAKLYVKSTAPAVVEVVTPAAGTEVPADGVIEIKGLADSTDAVKIQVLLGKADGPVIGEFEPHVFSPRRLGVRFHMVSINGTGPTRTAASLTDLLRDNNDIWRPTGLQFDRVDIVYDPIAGLAVAGTVSTDLDGITGPWQANEVSRVFQLSPHVDAINVYCVRAMADPGTRWRGVTWDNTVARPTGYGIALTDAATATDFAHEIGHFLSLNHADGGNMWELRRLMQAGWPPAFPAHRNNVGYGGGEYGALLTLKDMAGDPQDGEVKRALRWARHPY